MTSDPTTSETLSPRVNVWQRTLTFVIVIAMLAGMVLALTGCPHRKELPTQTEQTEQASKEVTVFFTKSKGNRSVTEAVVRPLPEDKEVTPIKYALENLLAGPTPEERKVGYFSEVPKGTKLLSVNKTDDSVTVDFSEQFTSGGGSNSIIQRMAEVQNTIIAASKNSEGKVLKVTFLINGKPMQTVGGEGLEAPTDTAHNIQ